MAHGWIIYQHADPKHVYESTRNELEGHRFKLLSGPFQSSDPTGKLWGEFRGRVERGTKNLTALEGKSGFTFLSLDAVNHYRSL